ncbi:hypothetical protein GQ457_04G005190 [Hibiscus cannabinus]
MFLSLISKAYEPQQTISQMNTNLERRVRTVYKVSFQEVKKCYKEAESVYCIRGDEKILLYEYMPNKSLDSFIFPAIGLGDTFNVILGVARGLLYLHQDSRLRIIHRDLK